MPINSNHKIIFIHVPKTGGTSIEQILEMMSPDAFLTYKPSRNTYSLLPLDKFTSDEYRLCASKNLQHFTLRELQKVLDPQIYKEYKKISVVRNPYERLVSEFAYSQKTINRHHNFDMFVKKNLAHPQYLRNWLFDGHLETQTSFLINEENNFNSIDKIYRYENLQDCLKDLNSLTGKNTYPHLYKSAHQPYQEYYTQYLQELVYNFYKEDFINFNYSFEL